MSMCSCMPIGKTWRRTAFVVHGWKVYWTGMKPTRFRISYAVFCLKKKKHSLDDQERNFVNKFVYRIEAIQRGDIVVFRYPLAPTKSFINRVISLAGYKL